MNECETKWQSTRNENSCFKIKFACLWLHELTYHLGNRLLILSYNSPMDEKLQIFSICHIKNKKRRRLLTSNTKKSIFFRLQKFPSLPLTCATRHPPVVRTLPANTCKLLIAVQFYSKRAVFRGNGEFGAQAPKFTAQLFKIKLNFCCLKCLDTTSKKAIGPRMKLRLFKSKFPEVRGLISHAFPLAS